MRLIDADRLLESKRIGKYYHLPNGDIAIPLIDIEHAPSIDAVKHGRWEYISFLTVECSECKAQIHDLEYSNFCPNCGARMEGSDGC